MFHKEGEDILQRPLYVFDLPEELLLTLALKKQTAHLLQDISSQVHTSQVELSQTVDATISAQATSCNTCGLNFTSVTEQRNHVRSDLHGYNLKQKLRGAKPVDEIEFDKLIGDLDESISGSESSESGDEENDRDFRNQQKTSTLSMLLKKQARISSPEVDEFASHRKRNGSGKPPLLWFSSSIIPSNISLGIYSAIFSRQHQNEVSRIVDIIREKQLAPRKLAEVKPNGRGIQLPETDIGPHYFLCMIGGGHFAAMVVALAPKQGKKHNSIEERTATVVAHKTFHRYTTRRKQGGSQSANDSAKGNAHSVGAQIRRANEVALTNEVRELLSSWKTLIDTAELIFIRATGSTNRRTLLGPYEGQVLSSNDARNRGFPFSTRRATQKELMRAFVELTRVKISNVDEAVLAALEATPESAAAPQIQAKPSPVKLSKEEEMAGLHTSQIMPLIKRSKVPALLNYMKTNDIAPTFSFFPINHRTPTPLHLAASLNSVLVVVALLTKAGVDPTVMNDDGKTAFGLAGDRATRDSFRVARSDLGESAWDWEKAGVPAPLTRVEADRRQAQEKSEKAAEAQAESARRKTETERVRKESEEEEARRREQKSGKGKAIGALAQKPGIDMREGEMRGLAPEARARLERERRARAAEERFKRRQES